MLPFVKEGTSDEIREDGKEWTNREDCLRKAASRGIPIILFTFSLTEGYLLCVSACRITAVL